MPRDLRVLEHLRKSSLFEPAKAVVATLRRAGYTTYFAGGAVRDALLDRPLKDLDIATAARPKQVSELFSSVVDIGSQFGVLGVKAGGHLFEVTSFRSDGDYKDGRRPEVVRFTDLQTDAKRRDFTINALYLDPENGEVFDFVDGLQDLKNQILRTVGDPEARLQEDHLRILRALRFCAALGFAIEPETLKAMGICHQQIGRVAKERVTQEVEKLLIGEFVVKALDYGLSCGALDVVLGFKIKKQTLKLLLLIPVDLSLRLAGLLFWQREPQQRREFFARFCFSKAIVRKVEGLLNTCELLEDERRRPGEHIEILGTETGLKAFNLLTTAQSVEARSASHLSILHDRYRQVATSDGELPEPLITPQTLFDRGLKANEHFGQLLRESYWLQLEGSLHTTTDALAWLKSELQNRR